MLSRGSIPLPHLNTAIARADAASMADWVFYFVLSLDHGTILTDIVAL
jgi:hypothetical protein